MKIRIRDDDVLPDKRNALVRFKEKQGWIQEHPAFTHVIAIVVSDLMTFDDAVTYIKEEVREGRMIPEIHGWVHIDYNIPKPKVIEHLAMCKEWIHSVLNYQPTIWYTPWGASQSHLHEAASEMGLKLVDTSQISKLKTVCRRLREGESIDILDGMEILTHWWSDGHRLKRVVESVKHGSWDAAAKLDEELFGSDT